MKSSFVKISPLVQDTGRAGSPSMQGPVSPESDQGLPTPLLKPFAEKEQPAGKGTKNAAQKPPFKTPLKKPGTTPSYNSSTVKAKTTPTLVVSKPKTSTVQKITPSYSKPTPAYTKPVPAPAATHVSNAAATTKSTAGVAIPTVVQPVKKASVTVKAEPFVKPRPDVTYISMPPHLLRVKSNGPVTRPVKTDGWIFYILMIIMLALALIRLVHNKSISVLRKAFVSYSISSQVVRDDNILYQQASAILSLLFFFSAALFAYQLSYRYSWSMPMPINGIGKYLIFTVSIAAIYSIKLLVFRMLGYLFKIDKIMNQYIFNVFLINNMLGLILIPFIIIGAFASPDIAEGSVYIALFIVLLSFLFRLFRGIQLGLSHPKFSLYYLFLYLCTLEIAPVLFVYKLLK